MTPVFIYTIISCALFWFIYSKKSAGGTHEGYSAGELIPFYTVMRLVPLFMMKERSVSNYIAFGIDALVLAAVIFTASGASKSKSTAAALYLFFPLPVICMAVGTTPAIITNIAVTGAALGILSAVFRKYPLYSPYRLTGGLAALGTGIHLGAYSLFAQNHTFRELISKDDCPVFLAAGIALAVTGIVMMAVTLRKTVKLPPSASEKSSESASFSPSYEAEKFGSKNIVHMTALTVIYAVLVFWQLGSHTTPETGQCFNSNDSENAEIIIDLGEYLTVSKLDIFLGPESLRKVNVSAFNESTHEWEFITDKELPTAFAWNQIDLSWNLRYIGIVFSGENTTFNEIVIVGSDGNTIIPKNAEERPYLYDEQDLYPGSEATYYYRMMFDEIYHGRTGYEFLHNLSIYENTHPPLGKTIIAGGIAIFGMNPFGWRFMVAVFGTLMVPVMYMFAWKLSHRSGTALTAGLLLSTEFMHFTLSRIATIDIIVATFILMMFLFMYCFIDEMNRNGSLRRQIMWISLCGVSTALAIATKWTGIYAAGGLAVLLFTFLIKHCAAKGSFKENLPYLIKLCIACVVSFIVIPLTVYVLSYFEFAQVYTDKNIIQHAIENSKSMLSYHSAVFDSHPYESPWYTWFLDKQPLLDAVNVVENDKISSVATFANPLIAFAGLAAFFHNVYLWRSRKCIKAQFLSVSYIAMLMPWMFIHRTVFIYQYFGCMLIIVLLICNSILNLKGSIKKKERIIVIASVLLFIMFFPETTGIPVARSYTKHFLELVPTWIFE